MGCRQNKDESEILKPQEISPTLALNSSKEFVQGG